MKWLLVVFIFGGFGFLVAIAAKHRDRWIPGAIRRNASKLDAEDMEENWVHEVVTGEVQDARDKGVL